MEHSGSQYWFTPMGQDSILSVNIETKENKLWANELVMQATDKQLYNKFVEFRTNNPEGILFLLPKLNIQDITIEHYLRLLEGSYLSKLGAMADKSSYLTGWSAFKTYLLSTDINAAPFSASVYHYHGGLIHYLCNTAKIAIKLVDSGLFTSTMTLIGTTVFCALTHRLDKLNRYIYSFTDTGNISALKLADNMTMKYGGSVSSILLLSRFFNLTDEEQLAIRWVRGTWHLDPIEYNDLYQANAAYPLVRLLQFASSMAFD